MIGYLVLVAIHTARSEGPLLANKCCPSGYQVNDWFNACVQLPSADVNVSEPIMEQENITQILERLGGDTEFPPWMDPNTILFDPESEKPLTGSNYSFLGNASEGAILRYGNWPCEREDSKFLHSIWLPRYKLFANGSLQMMVNRTNGTSATEDQLMLNPEEWCTDRFQAATPRFVIFTCPCERITCVSRCCYKGALHVVTPGVKSSLSQCARFPEAIELAPAFYEGRCPVAGRALANAHDIADGDGKTQGTAACMNVTREDIVYTTLDVFLPSCLEGFEQVLLNTEPPSKREPLRVWLQRNGSVVAEDYGHGKAIHRHDACVERTLIDEEELDSTLFCFPRISEQPPTAEDIYYSLLFLLGGVFLLLTLGVHIAVPTMRRSPHAKALCCHCASLLVASVTLTAGHIRRRLWEPYCSITGFLVQFSFLATFFWLNVMCFDLSWTFSAMRRNIPGQQKASRRFLYYSLYAWGFPIFITAIAMFMEFAPGDIVDPRNPMRPNIGVSRCSFDSRLTTLIYYYGPMGLLQLINLAMFGWTVWRIRSAKRDTSILRRGSGNARAQGGGGGTTKSRPSKSDDNNKDMAMYTKLFLLMGVTWLTELFAYFADEAIVFFWYVTDAINLLRGIAIFILFCWKPPVVDPLRKRVRSLARRCGCPFAEEAKPGSRPSHTSISTVESSVSMADDSPAPEAKPQPQHNSQESVF